MIEEKENNGKSPLTWLWLSVVVVVLDQVTKSWAAAHFSYLGQSVEVLPVFNLVLAHNYGAAFSFLSAADGWQRWFFSAVAIVVGVVLVVWLKRLPSSNRWMAVSLTLILGGALGNLYDRLTLGYVIDFLDFHWGNHHFPAFNVADSGITVGAVMMAIDAIWHPNDK